MKMYLKPIILSNFSDDGGEGGELDPIGLIGTLTGGDEGGENVLTDGSESDLTNPCSSDSVPGILLSIEL